MTPEIENKVAGDDPHRGSSLEVLRGFFKLGVSSFGGPIAHIGYFHEEFVVRRRWLSRRPLSIWSLSASSCRARRTPVHLGERVLIFRLSRRTATDTTKHRSGIGAESMGCKALGPHYLSQMSLNATLTPARSSCATRCG